MILANRSAAWGCQTPKLRDDWLRKFVDQKHHKGVTSEEMHSRWVNMSRQQMIDRRSHFSFVLFLLTGVEIRCANNQSLLRKDTFLSQISFMQQWNTYIHRVIACLFNPTLVPNATSIIFYQRDKWGTWKNISFAKSENPRLEANNAKIAQKNAIAHSPNA